MFAIEDQSSQTVNRKYKVCLLSAFPMPCPSMCQKYILNLLNHFGRVPIILSDPIRFGRVQIIKTSPEKSNLNLTKIIWTRLKRSGPNQNN